MSHLINTYPLVSGKQIALNTGSGSFNSGGTTFTNNGSYVIDSVGCYLSKSGSPTGTVYAVLYAITGTPGTGSGAVPTGTPLASSDTINASSLTTTPTYTVLNFTGAQRYAMVNGTTYAIAITPSAGTTSNQVILQGSNAVSSQNAVDLVGGSGWGALNTQTMAFSIYGASSIAPVTDFIASGTVVNLGDTIAFTDTSTNEPQSWSWDFGDGGTSTEQNPTHTYAAAGTYTVALTATNDGGSNTQTKTDYITVVEPATISGISSITGINSIIL